MEAKEEILQAVNEAFTRLDRKFDQRFDRVDQHFDQIDQRFSEVDQRFQKLEQEMDRLHLSQIKLEEMRDELRLVAEDVTHLKTRFAAWEGGEDEESIPVRVSRLEMRVTRLEKKRK